MQQHFLLAIISPVIATFVGSWIHRLLTINVERMSHSIGEAKNKKGNDLLQFEDIESSVSAFGEKYVSTLGDDHYWNC